MEFEVTPIYDPTLIRILNGDDYDGFKNNLEEDITFYIYNPVKFNFKEEALAYIEGLNLEEVYPLTNFREKDLPFIKIYEDRYKEE